MKKRFTFNVEEKVIQELKFLSEETRVPASRYVEEAIKDVVNKYSKKIKDNKDV